MKMAMFAMRLAADLIAANRVTSTVVAIALPTACAKADGYDHASDKEDEKMDEDRVE